MSKKLRDAADWLNIAVHLSRVSGREAQQSWLFHLSGAERRDKIDVRVEAGTHYQAASTLERIGALAELRRHRSYIAFEITEMGRRLLGELRTDPTPVV